MKLNLKKSDKIILGLAGGYMIYHFLFRGLSSIGAAMQSIALNGIDVLNDKLGLILNFAVTNPTLMSVNLHRISGTVYINNQEVGAVDQVYDRKLKARKTSVVPVLIETKISKMSGSLKEAIVSGDVASTTVQFLGKVEVGSKNIVSIPVNKTVMWGALVK